MKTDSAKYGKRWQIERKRVQREIAAGRGVCELCAVDAAAAMHSRLERFRDRMTKGKGPPPAYDSGHGHAGSLPAASRSRSLR